MTPTSKINHASHEGIFALDAKALDHLTAALGLKAYSQRTPIGKAELPGRIENILREKDEESLSELIETNQCHFAAALGYKNPEGLSHVGQIEQHAALVNRVQQLIA